MPNRREFLGNLAAASSWLAAPGAFADALARTPSQTEGPFYPNHIPLDCDNDLLVVGDSLTPAIGTVTHLSGRVFSQSGEPVRNATVEIWQVDGNGSYIHTGSSNYEKRDRNFQGFGRFETASTGEYRFRTIKPVPYDRRTPHIHMAVLRGGKRVLTTQLYVRGEPLNQQDFIFREIRDRETRELLLVDFTPIPRSRIGELAARFDIVISHTPEDAGSRRIADPRR
jgi:protocatechuate 3,4-dioxygenase beta subunit